MTAATADPFMSSRKRIANVIILRDLDGASLQVQTLVLEVSFFVVEIE
jgi:hypothetical protein